MRPRDRLTFQTLETGVVSLFGERPLEDVMNLNEVFNGHEFKDWCFYATKEIWTQSKKGRGTRRYRGGCHAKVEAR